MNQTTTGKHDRVIENWATATITALPTGWQNVYRLNDGSVFAWPCPGILIQEHRSDELVWDIVRADGHPGMRTRIETCATPYDTRVVFAAGDEFGYLEPAMETGNYVATVAPGQDTAGFAEGTAA